MNSAGMASAEPSAKISACWTSSRREEVNRKGMKKMAGRGWYVATILNNVLKNTIINLAAEVAGLTFGKDIIVEF